MRQTIVAGNWKMNGSKAFVDTIIKDITANLEGIDAKVIVCAPSVFFSQIELLSKNSALNLGAQDLSINASGAFTGEISANMIKEFGASYTIVGHSERRSLYGEDNDLVAKKVKVALDSGLTPLFCIGEQLLDRESGKTELVLAEQLGTVIDLVGIEAFKNIVIAYEPVWAIGTGVTASPEQAQDTHAFIRGMLLEKSTEIAQKVQILYGGSMNPGNAKALLACEDIDGGLIGGASLKAEDFLQICKAG
jgi:triosephosphate isomerase